MLKAVLHLCRRAPAEAAAVDAWRQRMGSGDAVVLLENAVLGCRRGSLWGEAWQATAVTRRVFVMLPDLAARGILPSSVAAGIDPIDYAGLVALCCEYDLVQSW